MSDTNCPTIFVSNVIFNSETTLNSTLNVSGSTTLADTTSNTLNVSGATTLANTTASTLNVTGATTLANTTAGSLNVTGATTLANTTASTLNVTGATTLANTTASTLNVTGTTTLANTTAGSLNVTGATTLANTTASTLNVTGATTLANTTASTLNVTGTTTLADIKFTAEIKDYNNHPGTDGQVLSSKYVNGVQKVEWITSSDASADKISLQRLGPSGQSPTTVDRTDTTSDLLVTEQSLLNHVGGNLTQAGAPYIVAQPKLYITDTTNTKEINDLDAQSNNAVEFIKAKVLSSKEASFDGTDDRRLATCSAIANYVSLNFQPLGSSSGSSSSLTIATPDATSTATRTAQQVGTGIFYQNGTQLRVQYKSSSSNYQDVLIGAFDTTSPVITITGDNPASVTEGTTYTDAGATAVDNVDGDVTSSIETTINVDTATVGTNYSVTYSVEDSAGNIATAIRAVHVVSALPTPVYSGYTTTPLTAPSGMITTSNALPGPNDDYTIQTTIKFNGHVEPSVMVLWGSNVGNKDCVYFALNNNNTVAVGHANDDLTSPYNQSITTDGQDHTFHITFKNLNGTRTLYIYLDGSLLTSGVKVGPVNMESLGQNQLWLGDGYGPAGWDPTYFDFEFGEIKDVFIYDVAFYPGSTAPPGWT